MNVSFVCEINYQSQFLQTRMMMACNEALAVTFPEVSIKYALGVGLFSNTIITLGTERHRHYAYAGNNVSKYLLSTQKECLKQFTITGTVCVSLLLKTIQKAFFFLNKNTIDFRDQRSVNKIICVS